MIGQNFEKTDIFPFEPYKGQGKTVMNVIVKHPDYVRRLVADGKILLTAEAREVLEKFRIVPIANQTKWHGSAGKVEVSGRIIHRTAAAVLFENEFAQGWIPAQFFEVDASRTENDSDVMAWVPEWLAVRDGFV